MVCQSVKEYEKLLELLKKFNARGWVNTCLRYFSSWRKIKEQIDMSKPLYVSIIASNVSALGTNAIHYLDLFSWFIDDYKIKLDGNFLINELFPNKTNVEIVEIINRKIITMRVWERGAGITLACGSGACAAVYAGILKNLLKNINWKKL